MKPTIIAIDDEKDLLKTYQLVLKKKFNVLIADSGEAGLEIIKKQNPETVLLDIRMPDWNGVKTLKEIKKYDKDLDVIMVTASQELKTAIDSMKQGAYDFIVKPFDVEELIKVITNAIEKRRLMKENLYLKDSLLESNKYQEMIGHSNAISNIIQTIETIAPAKSTILITGESGTGKELIARAIHNASPREKNPYVVVNCAAIPEKLCESTLFGHEAGSFTGADTKKLGKFEIADTGTIFLDEIGCLPYSMQSKLLRILQESVVERVGGSNSLQVDIRIIAATNTDLSEQVKNGKFREDLFFRLNVIPIHVSPLRYRKDDIPLLAQHFIQKFNTELNKKVKGFAKDAQTKLLKYDWPGNVRELQNIIERAVVLTKNDLITAAEIHLSLTDTIEDLSTFSLARTSFEKELIKNTLSKTKGNQTQAARLLGIHRTTLISKMKVLGIK
ncbi:MAG: sigma-54 dependent transcriptional regulator [Candidatus Margulisbacteria bacterium]|nr:sigma-54 dependent transcriptional regulator [Candidatus Margulisiibacteriota bacterium]MBU1022069.1 sigma-54 dependent transcriptional regulator [Candidatus Margulisiibacteriota bacterium]MBU1729664.1 sigma-54 dependent transcriptional regulator [Candidatus Margulisiibacteriota bacterium]MBU1954984.1 sigma-54 dependent transcriptional regulator [Candidatus Margulisiibacteriota bacterium]